MKLSDAQARAVSCRKRRVWRPVLRPIYATTGLIYEGAGAKTAAGYGGFCLLKEAPPQLSSPKRKRSETTVTLSSPGFLAGAAQEQDDCDLRSAMVRGLLRWWWRTMHAGFVDNKTLRRLETTIWGDTQQSGAMLGPVEVEFPWPNV